MKIEKIIYCFKWKCVFFTWKHYADSRQYWPWNHASHRVDEDVARRDHELHDGGQGSPDGGFRDLHDVDGSSQREGARAKAYVEMSQSYAI